MEVPLVDTGFYVGELQQLAQRIGVVEVVERVSEHAPAHAAAPQLGKYLHQHLDAAGGDEGDGEIEALAGGKLPFDDRKHIRLRTGTVADDARGIALVRFDLRIDEARLERVSEIDDAVFHVSHWTILRERIAMGPIMTDRRGCRISRRIAPSMLRQPG